MAYVRAILLSDSEGTYLDDGAVVSAIKWLISSPPTRKRTNVVRGELLMMKQDSQYNFSLIRDAKICLNCSDKDVGYLTEAQFHLLEAVNIPIERLDAYFKKLLWGDGLQKEDIVYVIIPEGISYPSECAMAIVKYKGEIGSRHGIHFGVEIVEHISAVATTDGTYEGKRYFTCDSGRGLFVPLNLLSRDCNPDKPKENKPYVCGFPNRKRASTCGSPKAESDKASLPRPHSNNFFTKFEDSTLQQGHSPKPSDNSFPLNQHVVFLDKHNAEHYGVIRWIGTGTSDMAFTCPVVGIQTDEEISLPDFDGLSVIGIGHQMKQVPAGHALFLPETSVEKFEPRQSQGRQFAVGGSELEESIKMLKKTDAGTAVQMRRQQADNVTKRAPKVPEKSKKVQARKNRHSAYVEYPYIPPPPPVPLDLKSATLGRNAGKREQSDFKTNEVFTPLPLNVQAPQVVLRQRSNGARKGRPHTDVFEEPSSSPPEWQSGLKSRPHTIVFEKKQEPTSSPAEWQVAWKRVQGNRKTTEKGDLISDKSMEKTKTSSTSKTSETFPGQAILRPPVALSKDATNKVVDDSAVTLEKSETTTLPLNPVSPLAEGPIVSSTGPLLNSDEKVGMSCKTCIDPHRLSCGASLVDTIPEVDPHDIVDTIQTALNTLDSSSNKSKLEGSTASPDVHIPPPLPGLLDLKSNTTQGQLQSSKTLTDLEETRSKIGKKTDRPNVLTGDVPKPSPTPSPNPLDIAWKLVQNNRTSVLVSNQEKVADKAMENEIKSPPIPKPETVAGQEDVLISTATREEPVHSVFATNPLAKTSTATKERAVHSNMATNQLEGINMEEAKSESATSVPAMISQIPPHSSSINVKRESYISISTNKTEKCTGPLPTERLTEKAISTESKIEEVVSVACAPVTGCKKDKEKEVKEETKKENTATKEDAESSKPQMEGTKRAEKPEAASNEVKQKEERQEMRRKREAELAKLMSRCKPKREKEREEEVVKRERTTSVSAIPTMIPPHSNPMEVGRESCRYANKTVNTSGSLPTEGFKNKMDKFLKKQDSGVPPMVPKKEAEEPMPEWKKGEEKNFEEAETMKCYKTRQERKMEREEMRQKADAEVAELKLRYKVKREKEREEREKEELRERERKEREKEDKTRQEREKKEREKEEEVKRESATSVSAIPPQYVSMKIDYVPSSANKTENCSGPLPTDMEKRTSAVEAVTPPGSSSVVDETKQSHKHIKSSTNLPSVENCVPSFSTPLSSPLDSPMIVDNFTASQNYENKQGGDPKDTVAILEAYKRRRSQSLSVRKQDGGQAWSSATLPRENRAAASEAGARTKSESEHMQPVPKPRRKLKDPDAATVLVQDCVEYGRERSASVHDPTASELRRTIDLCQQKISKMEKEAGMAEANNLKLTEKLRTQQLEIQAKEKEIRAKSEIIRAKHDQLQLMEGVIKDRENEVKDRENEVKDRENEIKAKNDQIQVMAGTITAKNEEIGANYSTMKTKDGQIALKAQEILELRQDNREKRREIIAKDTKIEAKNDEIAAKNGEIQAKVDTIKAREIEIATKNGKIQAKDDTIKAMEIEIAAKNDEIKAKDNAIKTKEIEAKAQVERKNQQIADLHKFIVEAEKRELTRKSWSIPRAEIERVSKREIGRGAWGMVYSGTFRGERVAIKQPHRAILHHTTIDLIKREVRIMSEIHYPNLLRFIGAVFGDLVERGLDMPIIVFELMDMNLREAYTNLKIDLSNSLISIFCDVAYALHYLHQRPQPIIHRDVSAPNVLLKALENGSYVTKVSDFGSANLAKQAQTAGAGAIVYSAPEMFPNEDITAPPQLQTTKVDVFSYGILLLEVMAKEMPKSGTRYSMLQKVSQQSKPMYELIVHCTKALPSDRPTMEDILNKLNSGMQ